LKRKLSEHQQRQLETKYCHQLELHRLQAEIIHVTESLNARQKDLEAERCHTQLVNKELEAKLEVRD